MKAEELDRDGNVNAAVTDVEELVSSTKSSSTANNAVSVITGTSETLEEIGGFCNSLSKLNVDMIIKKVEEALTT